MGGIGGGKHSEGAFPLASRPPPSYCGHKSGLHNSEYSLHISDKLMISYISVFATKLQDYLDYISRLSKSSGTITKLLQF